jgi:hypothetical protein
MTNTLVPGQTDEVRPLLLGNSCTSQPPDARHPSFPCEMKESHTSSIARGFWSQNPNCDWCLGQLPGSHRPLKCWVGLECIPGYAEKSRLDGAGVLNARERKVWCVSQVLQPTS